MLYISLHRFPFYPGAAGDPSNVGAAAGVGHSINIGWPVGGVCDGAYREVKIRSLV